MDLDEQPGYIETNKNETAEKKVRTPCDALPIGWTKEIVARRSGLSAGKSDVYYYSPTGKKVRSKPELAQLLLQINDEVIDLTNFDFRSGSFVVASAKKATRKRKQPNPVDVYSKDLIGISMAFPTVPARQSTKISNEPVTVVSKDASIVHSIKDISCNGAHLSAEVKDIDIASPRQIFWERRLQSMNCSTNCLEDSDIFSNKNGEFHSLLLSIVKTLQMERDLANKRTPLGTVACSSTNHEQPPKTSIKITKADILRQEKEVVKARKELAKAITEYEAVKSL